MILTYALGGGALAVSFAVRGTDPRAAALWAAAGAVGITGVLSFVRHAVFHRSDAVRMGWDLGRRNDFQIEVGFANLALGLTGIACWAFGWATAAAGAVTLAFGLYLFLAGGLHLSEVRRDRAQGGGRLVAALMSLAFAVALVVAALPALG